MENTTTTNTEAVATAKAETSAPTPKRTFAPRAGGAKPPFRKRTPGSSSKEGDARGGRKPRDGRGGGMRSRERVKPEFEQKILDIRRVTRVVSGGRRFSFSVAVVAGDKNGRVGLGTGKAGDTSLAIEKAFKDAKKKMITLKLTKTKSISHDINTKFASSSIFMMPNRGRGLIAGSSARVILALAGVTDVTAKFLSGSKNKLNNGKVAMEALKEFAYKHGEQKIVAKTTMVEAETTENK
jgi:small subunit ribosomal protein S5